MGDVTGKIELTPVAIAAGRRLSDRLFDNQADAKLDYEMVTAASQLRRDCVTIAQELVFGSPACVCVLCLPLPRTPPAPKTPSPTPFATPPVASL